MTRQLATQIPGSLQTVVAVLALIPALAYAGGPAAQPATPGASASSPVLPLESRPYGASYSEWSERWWQWFFSLPLDNSPLFGTADCRKGQSGNVWFLGGGPSPRPACTVPSGTALFFPIINTECSTLPGDNSGDIFEGGLRTCASFLANQIDVNTLSATLDSVPLTGLSQFRVNSPLFLFGPLPGPPENNLGYFFTNKPTPAGTFGLSVGDGFYLMLRPLPPGQHVLHFQGAIPSVFTVDMTYHLTVTN